MIVIHTLRLRYSNAYLVVGARPILVDTGSRGDAARIVADDLPLAMTSLDRVLAVATGRLFVGHGGPLRCEDVRPWRETVSMNRKPVANSR